MGNKRKDGNMILVDTNIFIEYYKNNPLICKQIEHIDPKENCFQTRYRFGKAILLIT